MTKNKSTNAQQPALRNMSKACSGLDRIWNPIRVDHGFAIHKS